MHFEVSEIVPRSRTFHKDAGALDDFVGTYRWNRRGHTTWEKSYAFLGDVTVSRHTDGGLLAKGSRVGVKHFVRLAEDVFRNIDNSEDRIAFGRDPDGNVSHVFLKHYPVTAGVRIGLLEKASTHRIILWLGGFVMAAVVIGALLGIPTWSRRRPGERIAQGLILAASVLSLFFLYRLMGAMSVGFGELIFRGVPGLSLLLTISFIAGLLSLGALAMVVPAWTTGFWSTYGRVRYTLTAILLVTLSWSLWYWNLVGPWNT